MIEFPMSEDDSYSVIVNEPQKRISFSTKKKSFSLGNERDFKNQHKFNESVSTGMFFEESDYAQAIVARAYNSIKSKKRLLVLVNPHSGAGKAKQIFETQCRPILEAAKCRLDVVETTHRFHAHEIAKSTKDIRKRYDAIVCCSGDGIPHEIINGFAQRPDAEKCLAQIPICQLPGGSGNSMSLSVNGSVSPTKAALSIVKGVSMPIDLMHMSQGDKKILTFLTQSFGTIADADLGTEPLRWMGTLRFTLGALYFTLGNKTYPCDVYVKYAHKHEDDTLKAHYNSHDPLVLKTPDALVPKYGTVNDPVPSDWSKIPDCENLSILYAGKFPYVSSDVMMFPAALPTDGTMDFFMTKTHDIKGPSAVSMLLSLENGKHIECKGTEYAKILAYRLVPKNKTGYLSIDGEIFPHEAFQVEVLRSTGCLLVPPSANGKFIETGY